MAIRACTYNVHHDNPKLLRTVKGKGYWLIKMWATNDVERIEKEVRNLNVAYLIEIHDLVSQEFVDCIAELSPITDGGFDIFFLRKS